MTEDILLQVKKPARYIGKEWNLPRKDFAKSDIKFALCFPDLYEVGMSNLGIRIIYGLLNSRDDVVCERFFSPDIDMERLLRSFSAGICSLESGKGLGEFDIVGFSLAYELGYTNVLNMLDLGAIPLKSALRDNRWPLVIAGGPCVLNPEPMQEFFDLFLIGEAEEALLEIIDVYRKLKAAFRSGSMSKQDLLFAFSEIEGVYVPSFYEVCYNAEGKIGEFKPKIKGIPAQIKKRFVKDLNSAYFPLEWVMPYIQVIHDRAAVEIMRGCPNSCRFCQARSQYFPFRQRDAKKVFDLASCIYKCTGYEELSLAGLSVSDYANLEELLGILFGFFKKKAVSISLPSIKPKLIVGKLSGLIASIKKTGFTFAPEAASERLRGILNKDFSLSDFWESVEAAYANGYQHIKLYFMIGLPYEEREDLAQIIEFATAVSRLRAKVSRFPAQVNISVNTLIPKPHTPFQWFAMQDLEDIRQRQEYIKDRIKNKRLKFSFHNRFMSVLEGVLSRGDRRLGEVILNVFNKGARFDAWKDHFVFEKWQEAFDECNIDYRFYLKEKSKDEVLPWDFVETGIKKEYLKKENEEIIKLK